MTGRETDILLRGEQGEVSDPINSFTLSDVHRDKIENGEVTGSMYVCVGEIKSELYGRLHRVTTHLRMNMQSARKGMKENTTNLTLTSQTTNAHPHTSPLLAAPG
ncbi:hypothetical protein GOODEAATRI_028965 [Goodea atripinnis]|uniref:Uncharacterized protein n=1 Tax=Goodea atripinnis TaxID=208336 RepID=A0ABV0MLL0_9TELE